MSSTNMQRVISIISAFPLENASATCTVGMYLCFRPRALTHFGSDPPPSLHFLFFGQRPPPPQYSFIWSSPNSMHQLIIYLSMSFIARIKQQTAWRQITMKNTQMDIVTDIPLQRNLLKVFSFLSNFMNFYMK